MCALLLLTLQGKLLYSIASRIKYEKSEEEFVARIHRLVARVLIYQLMCGDLCLQRGKGSEGITLSLSHMYTHAHTYTHTRTRTHTRTHTHAHTLPMLLSVFVELTMKAFIYYQALMRDRLQKSKDMVRHHPGNDHFSDFGGPSPYCSLHSAINQSINHMIAVLKMWRLM